MDKIRKISQGLAVKQPVYIVAEMACAHDGKYELAKRIVDAAAEAGADAIQFQMFIPEEFIYRRDPDYNFLKNISLSIDEWVKLFEQARKNNLEVLVTACDRKAIDLAEACNVDGYKVHSADLNNSYLLDYLAPLGKPIRLGVGGSFWHEIKSAVKTILKQNKELILMYGIQNFPTSFNSVNLNAISELKNEFKLPVGYEDHTDPESAWSFWLPVISLGLSVMVLEKHITHDRSKKGVDYQASLNPDEFSEFVKTVRTAERILGQGGRTSFLQLNTQAQEYRKYAKTKRTIVAARPISAGKKIKPGDLMVMRCSKGKLLPHLFGSLIGQKVKKDLAKFHAISQDDFEAKKK